MVCQISDTHLLCVCLFCGVLVVLLESWAVNGVMVPDSTRIYVGFVG